MNWNELLFEKGLDIPLEETQFNILCPLHEDSKPSMSINTTNAVWICHAGCGQGTLRQLYRKLYGPVPITFNPNMVLSEDVIFNFDDDEDDIILPEVKIPFKLGSVPKWIFERGFSKDILKNWNCGVSDEKSLFIPVTENKKTVGWICRRRAGVQPKYLYSPGMKISKVVFGADRIRRNLDYLCITEGTLDTIWMDQNHFPSVALLGLTLSRDQENILGNLAPKEYILCLDNDGPGQEASYRIAERLEKFAPVSEIRLPTGVKDVQDIREPEKLKEIIGKRLTLGGL